MSAIPQAKNSFGCQHDLARNPAVEVCKRALRERALLGDGLSGPTQALAVRPFVRNTGKRRKQAEVHIHRLERAWPGVDGLDMASGNVAKQRTVRGGRWWRRQRLAAAFGRREATRKQAHGGGFDVTLAAGDLAGEPQAGGGREAQVRVEPLWGIEGRVAGDATKAGGLRPANCRNGAGDRRP